MGAIVICTTLTLLAISAGVYYHMQDLKSAKQSKMERKQRSEFVRTSYDVTGGKQVHIESGQVTIN